MPRPVIACWLFLAMTGVVFAEDDMLPLGAGSAAFTEGKKLLAEGKDARPAFARAMRAFQTQGDGLPIGTARAQSFGNAAFLADDLPRAILAYRHGLYFDRHSEVLRDNLSYARSQVRYSVANQNGRPEPDAWPQWLPRWRSSWLLGIAAASYCAAWLALAIGVVRRDRRLAAVVVTCFALAGACAYGCQILRTQRTFDTDWPPVVILNDDVPLRTGNGPNYQRHAELPSLSRGMEARQLRVRGEWRQIRFHSGEIGWVPARDALTWSELWQP